MLTYEQNARLTQVGPGTPLGRFLRHYWIPAANLEEIAAPGGAPVRVGLLGEKLVAFRDPSSRINDGPWKKPPARCESVAPPQSRSSRARRAADLGRSLQRGAVSYQRPCCG